MLTSDLLVRFVSCSLFQHYGMYEFAFQGDRPVATQVIALPIMTPHAPAMLDEAVPHDEWVVNNPPTDANASTEDDTSTVG